MRKILLDEKKEKELISKGYTVIPFLSKEDVDYVLNRINCLSPDNNFNPNSSKNYGRTFHITHLDTNRRYRKDATDLIREVFLPRIEDILVDYKFLVGNLFVKPQGKGELAVHQNWHFTDNLNDITLSFWCPLVDVNETNGTIQLVEKSHKILPEIPNPFVTPYYFDFVDSIKKKYSKPINLKAGECLIFDDSLLHWSDVNKSSTPRYVIQALFIPSESTSVVYYINPHNTNEQFEILEISVDTFVEDRLIDLLVMPQNLKRIGYTENKNRLITEKEFVSLLNRSGDLGRNKYFKGESTETNNVGFFSRIKNLLMR